MLRPWILPFALLWLWLLASGAGSLGLKNGPDFDPNGLPAAITGDNGPGFDPNG